MANQFTKGTRTKQDESTKDRIRAELLAQRLFKFAKSKGEKAEKLRMDSAQVAAAKVLIERGKPALQAIEQTVINPDELKTPEQIDEELRAHFVANPAALIRIIESDPGLKAQLTAHLTGIPSVVSTQQSTAA